MHGQHFYRALVALAEVRRGVLAGLPDGTGGAGGHRPLPPVLQLRAAAPEPGVSAAGGPLPEWRCAAMTRRSIRKEGVVVIGGGAPQTAGWGGAAPPPPNLKSAPPIRNLLRSKNGLDNGGHFTPPWPTPMSIGRGCCTRRCSSRRCANARNWCKAKAGGRSSVSKTS